MSKEKYKNNLVGYTQLITTMSTWSLKDAEDCCSLRFDWKLLMTQIWVKKDSLVFKIGLILTIWSSTMTERFVIVVAKLTR